MAMFKSLTLTLKLTLAFLLVAFTTAALVAFFIRLTSASRLVQFLIEQQRSNLEQVLSNYYTTVGSWEGVEQNWQRIQFLAQPTPVGANANEPPPPQVPPGEPSWKNRFGLADMQGTVIVSVNPQYPPGTTLPPEVIQDGTPIHVGGEQVGTILTAPQPLGFSHEEELFLQRTNQALVYASLGALLVALVMGALLARTLTGPLHALTQAVQSITRGQLEQQVKVSSNDEIGQLAQAFNLMSQEVARVNQLRRQMTADIAHDLRTPITVISGYIESMRDGVLQPTPQRLSLIYFEIERLQSLVGDLGVLSLADAGELPLYPQWIAPQSLIDRAAALFRHQAEQQGIIISAETGAALPDIWVDEGRMMQVLGNLISNALRYTPAGGKVTLSARLAQAPSPVADRPSGEKIEICVQDTGSGVAAEELPYIFNRFHRADKSRHSESGEAGLGLAIVRALMESHGGFAEAESTLGAGTTIHLFLPLKPKS